MKGGSTIAKKLNEKALGYSLAILAALSMLLVWVGNFVGVYESAFIQMQNWHIFFSSSFAGLIGGILEASIWSFITGWLIARFYNKYS